MPTHKSVHPTGWAFFYALNTLNINYNLAAYYSDVDVGADLHIRPSKPNVSATRADMQIRPYDVVHKIFLM
ncbi:hypothetical protein [uncultured Ruminococcus sp.]|uniref:hypothetical protein n=1 Tax=uncultured Ruminococcus sp. TaxID=165186 RepID=UPI0025F4C517|nr:hypothetical protein [uncultured Ruminococcus sp.]